VIRSRDKFNALEKRIDMLERQMQQLAPLAVQVALLREKVDALKKQAAG